MADLLYSRFAGGWCDTCDIAAKTKNCPDCHQPMRAARITVEPEDSRDAELLQRVREVIAVNGSGEGAGWMARIALAVRSSYPPSDKPGLAEIRDAIRTVQDARR
jgi:hypothetical protein